MHAKGNDEALSNHSVHNTFWTLCHLSMLLFTTHHWSPCNTVSHIMREIHFLSDCNLGKDRIKMKLLGVVSVLIILIGMTVSWLKTYVKIDQIVRFKHVKFVILQLHMEILKKIKKRTWLQIAQTINSPETRCNTASAPKWTGPPQGSGSRAFR